MLARFTLSNLWPKAAILLTVASSVSIATAVELPVFLGDNNTSVSSIQEPSDFVQFNGQVYFQATGATGRALYRTNVTSGGLEMVKDITSGPESGPFSRPMWNAIFDNNLYFFSFEGFNGLRLWKSDGTEAGTQVIFSTYSDFSTKMVAGASGVYFGIKPAGEARRLYKTDGTDAGTTVVGNVTMPVVMFGEASGITYFLGAVGTDGAELWRTDGTDAGTYQVKDINSGPASSNISSFLSFDGSIYFIANDGVSTDALWKSDGTEAGTVKMSDVRVRRGSGLSEVNGVIYFAGDDTGAGQTYQLWKSDGNPGTAQMVLNTGGAGSYPEIFAQAGGQFVFQYHSENAAVHGLWKSDGTDIGTTRIADVSIDPAALVSAGGKIYFRLLNNYLDLWQSDGTPEGTFSIENQIPDNNKYPDYLASAGGSAFFTVLSGTGIDQLLKINPSTNEITPVVSPDGATQADFRAYESVVVGNKVYYSAWDGEHGRELWVSDGTPVGTHIVADITPGPVSSSPSKLTNVNGLVYFGVEDEDNHFDLWKTDGTEAGTVLVKNLELGRYWASTVVGGEYYFAGNSGSLDLWRSDGTDEGTTLVDTSIQPSYFLYLDQQWANLGNVLLYRKGSFYKVADPTTNTTAFLYAHVPGPYPTKDTNTAVMDGNAYFGAGGGDGSKLWKSDGTGTGTVALNGSTLFGGSSTPCLVSEPVAGKIFIYNWGDRKLWISDGTEAGTLPLVYIFKYSYDTSPIPVIAAGNKFMFPKDHRPWITDGTAAGTFELTNYGTDSTTASVQTWPLASSKDYAYFLGNDLVHGNELWRTDGTVAGTEMVMDINPGLAAAWPQDVVFAGGKLIFSAEDGINGRELWIIHEEGGQPEMIDIEAGSGSSSPTQMVVAGNHVIFQAYTSVNGADLWSLAIENDSVVQDWTLY